MENEETPTVLLTIAYDSGMDERVMETLEAQGAVGWTKTFDAHGSGGAGPKLNSPIFPGSVIVLSLVLPEEAAQNLAAALRALQQTYRRNPGLTMWAMPARLL